MHKLQINKYQQNSLFESKDSERNFKQEGLNKVIDNINKRYGKHTLDWKSSVIENDWNQRRNKLSFFKTTTMENIPIVFAH